MLAWYQQYQGPGLNRHSAQPMSLNSTAQAVALTPPCHFTHPCGRSQMRRVGDVEGVSQTLPFQAQALLTRAKEATLTFEGQHSITVMVRPINSGWKVNWKGKQKSSHHTDNNNDPIGKGCGCGGCAFREKGQKPEFSLGGQVSQGKKGLRTVPEDKYLQNHQGPWLMWNWDWLVSASLFTTSPFQSQLWFT